MATTKQVRDYIPNPDGKGGFGDNPQNRSSGRWSKEESISYWYNKLLRMTVDEYDNFEPANKSQAIARDMVENAGSKRPDIVKEITDRTEGKAPQFIGLGDGDDLDERIGATIVFEDKPED